VQQKRLPNAAPVLAGFDIGGASCPAQETGGDFFDFIVVPDGSLGIAVGDASGHGIGAALLMAETRAYLRALARNEPDIGRVLTLVNRHVAEDMKGDDFVTLFFGRLDPAARSLVYGSAGHWPASVLDDRGRVTRTLHSTGIPLGIDPDRPVPSAAALVLQPGDLMLFLSDGVVEAVCPGGTLFGVERTLASVRANHRRASGEIVAALFDDVRRFTHGAQSDDMTAVVLKVSQA
jgi:sigma-B regulation protein RsbU (phosphoserine phosphatase)